MSSSPLNNTFIKNKNDLQDQSKKKPSILIKEPAFKLTPKDDFEELKNKLLNAMLKKTDASVLNYEEILDTYSMASRLTNHHKEPHCSITNNIFLLDKKTKKLMGCFGSTKKFISANQAKLQLFFTRLYILDRISNLLPEPNRVSFAKNIIKYVTQGCSVEIPCKEVIDALAGLSEELLQSFCQEMQASKDTTNLLKEVKYAPILELNVRIPVLMMRITQQFKYTYTTYKSTLDMIKSTIELVDLALYRKIQETLWHTVLDKIPLNLSIYHDHHYFFHLVRLNIASENSVKDPNALPLFTPEELSQVKGYLAEIQNLLWIMYFINVTAGLNINVLQRIPVTNTINKKPSQFFNQPMSRNTFSLLLNYLSSVNYALTSTFLVFYSKLPLSPQSLSPKKESYMVFGNPY